LTVAEQKDVQLFQTNIHNYKVIKMWLPT
jgi:hypothetical protein